MAVLLCKDHAGVNDSGMSTLILWITLGLSALLHEVFPALLVSASVYWLQSSKETAAEV